MEAERTWKSVHKSQDTGAIWTCSWYGPDIEKGNLSNKAILHLRNGSRLSCLAFSTKSQRCLLSWNSASSAKQCNFGVLKLCSCRRKCDWWPIEFRNGWRIWTKTLVEPCTVGMRRKLTYILYMQTSLCKIHEISVLSQLGVQESEFLVCFEQIWGSTSRPVIKIVNFMKTI